VSPRLALVVAHPDDDTFGASGSVALHAQDPGFHLTVVHVTSGDKGEIADPSLATPENLGAVREAEDRASWRALGREPDRHEFLRFPDSGLADVPLEELVDAIAPILADSHPDVVVTFGPDGVTGHGDHIATGAAATEAFHRLRTAPDARGFVRLLHSAIPQSQLDWFSERLVERGMDPIDPTAPFQPRGVPDERIGVTVDDGAVWRRKFDALQEHRTQGGASGFPEDLQAEVLGHEFYVIAWPLPEAGAPILTDIFEGL
jgi:LmbE family N-acetylglucosaminyl deacetylase